MRASELDVPLSACPHCSEDHDEDTLRCPATDLPLPLEGRRLDGKFRFQRNLGIGGMASVWLAINERVEREVAIKLLRPETGRNPEVVARFRSEAKAAGRIGNPHICEVYDSGDSPIGPFIVMERLHGVDLSTALRTRGLLRLADAIHLAREALVGLAAAHSAGVVHRDLKPGNLFLHETPDGRASVKLMDFGVSKFLDGTGEAETASGILLGTPEYMAPEQLEGAHKIGPTADIFAIGAILYRSITGHNVYTGDNVVAVVKSMAVDEITPMSELVEGLPDAFEAVVHRCLARDPAARYQTADELAAALEPFEDVEAEISLLASPPATKRLVPSELPDQPIREPSEAKTRIWQEPTQGAPRRSMPALWIVGLIALVAGLGLFALWHRAGERGGQESERAHSDEADERTTATVPNLPAPDDHEDDLGDSGPELVDLETGEAGETGEPGTEGGSDEVEMILDEDEMILDEDETGETGETGEASPELDAGEDADADSDSASDSGDSGDTSEASALRPAPSGTTRGGPFVTPLDPSGNTDFSGAKQACEGLAADHFAGIGGWSLANPAQIAKFTDNKDVRRGRYWSSAVWRGRAKVYAMPSGKPNSEKISRKLARPFCVARW